ncbi:helix-turn-helix domain-containing protein [Streptomyces sp. MUM 136J]|uniref:PucR family transcriptional regulator n=1 Tax=Streptomyces sp. MUM 136J TaxID=2791992 RepID=UPI001F0366CB|nr:helix-turn-helix domain-containing protein [Streptomyces sp. MUM 136J]MCH0568268.1 helix-turn-helix domain-containing protein [Streptomyces sp. MUM 136J]
MTPLTVAGLCSHPSWSNVRPLAGGAYLEAEITDVRLVHGFRGQPGRNSLVVAVDAGDVSDWRIDVLLRKASDAGAAGLLLPTASPLLPTTVLLADRLAIAVVGSQDDSVVDLAVAAQEALAAPDIERMRFVLAAHHTVAQQQRAPEELAKAVSHLLGSDVAVLDRSGASIAGAPLVLPGFDPHPPVPRRDRDGTAVTVVVPVPSALGTAADLWLATVIEHQDATWERTVQDVLTVAVTGLQRWRAARRTELEREARLRTSLLAELLRLEAEPSPGLRRRLTEMGWRLDGRHVGVRIGVAEEVDILALSDKVHAALRAENLDAQVVEGADGWSAWVTLDREPTRTEVGELVSALRQVQRRLNRFVTSHVGVGRAHGGAEGLALSLGEAADAARLARGRREVGRFLHIDRLGFAQLLLAWTRTDTFEPAARELLAPLVDQPGDLIATVSAYLDAESRLTETAAVLGVHRNTVAARIARVEQVLGLDLANADERLALHLACRARLSLD